MGQYDPHKGLEKGFGGFGPKGGGAGGLLLVRSPPGWLEGKDGAMVVVVGGLWWGGCCSALPLETPQPGRAPSPSPSPLRPEAVAVLLVGPSLAGVGKSSAEGMRDASPCPGGDQHPEKPHRKDAEARLTPGLLGETPGAASSPRAPLSPLPLHTTPTSS